jgi:hypothetical protein
MPRSEQNLYKSLSETKLTISLDPGVVEGADCPPLDLGFAA